MTQEPRWLDKRALLLLHGESLAEHGGLEGLRDEALLDSALARPQHLNAYGEDVDIASLAAAYGYGIARNHPFLDGNKRAAFLAIGLFLGLNGHRLVVTQMEAIEVMLDLAAGNLSESDLAAWLGRQLRPR